MPFLLWGKYILMISKRKRLGTATRFEYMIWISDYLFSSKRFENKRSDFSFLFSYILKK